MPRPKTKTTAEIKNDYAKKAYDDVRLQVKKGRKEIIRELSLIHISRRLEVYPRRSNISINPNLYEINQTKAPCLYEELVFHDNLEDISFLHTHLREMAEATAKAFCDIFGVSFVDPYKKGEVTIMGKVVNRDELVAWIDRCV